jgi:HSP20 family protein
MAKDGQKVQRSLTVAKPSKEMRDVGEYFDDVFGRPFLPSIWGNLGWEEKEWAPSIEVIEKDDKYLVKAELPGVKEEDISLSISGNVLTIEGEKHEESEGKRDGYHYSEASYGSFARSITIPSSVDTAKIEANCDNGVLEISLPKVAEMKPKKISVAKKKAEPATRKEEAAKK